MQLDKDTGGLLFNGNLTTEHGSVYVKDGSVNVNGDITCKKLFVDYNGSPTDIITVFSIMLGSNRKDTSTGTTGGGGETTGS